MKRSVQSSRRVTCCLLTALLFSGCDSDLDAGVGNTNPGLGTEKFTLFLDSSEVSITEGADQIEVPVTLSRTQGHQGDITLSATGLNQDDELYLSRRFTDNELDIDEQSTSLQLALAIGPQPIQPHSRNILVTATDESGESNTASLIVQVNPTDKPDIYLLIGQSNMIGISEDNSKQADPGEPDEPVSGIRQLNVTFNDDENFSLASDFTNPEKLFDNSEPLTIALDPLHTGFQSDGSKTGMRIGLGLSFAKRAQQDTNADIYLVPAAWSDTGFCKRDTNRLPGIGWNATQKTNPQLSGTLLHDRAIARADITIAETGGILRGILWHQGEADSENASCAQNYAQNLTELIQSLRTNIAQDARGAGARGPDTDIPFIVGTMAMGGEQTPFSENKLLVDAAHRALPTIVGFTDFVNNDDLIPAAYPCGGGSCVHFGARALREMGGRYYERMISLF
ncbi:MAG: sialate O-acetylesterase [Granulosicoccus sp.]